MVNQEQFYALNRLFSDLDDSVSELNACQMQMTLAQRKYETAKQNLREFLVLGKETTET